MSTDNKDGNRHSKRSKGNAPRGRKPRQDDEGGRRSFDKKSPRKRSDRSEDDRFKRKDDESGRRGSKSFDKRDGDDRPRGRKPFDKKDRGRSDDSKREGGKNFATSRENYDKRHGKMKFERGEDTPAYKSKYERDYGKKKPYKGKRGSQVLPSESSKLDDRIRLNKYLSNSGLCTRREADEFIASGMVEVNGKTITEMGYKVNPGDVVKYAGERLSPEKSVYLLLNKPKDFVTTVKDPNGRSTVMQLIKGAGARVFPVGRLDRMTTGLLMLTNDGDLAKKLTHPKHNVKKLYHVQLDKNVKAEHLKQLVEGVELEDGVMAADVVSYVGDGKDKREVGIEIHSGKNRVVRRLFEGLGYKVLKLDRVVFAGLTKKDLPRGRWRTLTEQEINNLKMLK
jgi:23S rRNA pseudouridine2605 synthase